MRAAGDDVMLLNKTAGLPIEAECEEEPRKLVGQFLEKLQTRSDDRAFKLTRMPNEACRER